MLEGCVPWPAPTAAQYRACGWWEGITVPELLERSTARHPQKTALVSGDLRLSYAELAAGYRRLACRGWGQRGRRASGSHRRSQLTSGTAEHTWPAATSSR